MEIVKGLIEMRLRQLVAAKAGVLDMIQACSEPSKHANVMDNFVEENSLWCEKHKASFESYQNEIEELTYELQELLRMEIAVGMVPDVAASEKKARL